MVVLLAATTGLAMLMTSARTPSFDPAQPTHHFGDFVVSIPTNFTSQRDSRPDKPGVRSFVDTNQQLVLKIAVIDDAQRRPPVIALEQAKALLAPTAGKSESVIYQHGPLTVIQATGYSPAQLPNGQAVSQKHVMAAGTVDGASYIAAELSGLGRIRREDVNIVLDIMMSIHDTRFDQARAADLRLAEMRFPTAPALLALAPRVPEIQEQLLYVPSDGRYFYRLPVTVLSVDELWARFKDAYTGPEIEDPMRRAAAATKAMLQVTYAGVHSDLPSKEAFAEETIEGRPVAKLLVVGGGGATGHHERWAMLPDADHIIVVDVLADRRAVSQARSAARWLLSNTLPTETEAPAP